VKSGSKFHACGARTDIQQATLSADVARGWEASQAFTAMGEIVEDAPYQVELRRSSILSAPTYENEGGQILRQWKPEYTVAEIVPTDA
jgi:hypothetical protein